MKNNGTGVSEPLQEAPRRGWREDGTVDIDALRAGTPDLADAPAILESLCDEVERLRGPGRCPASGRACYPKFSIYGTTSASLIDYDHQLGDSGAEVHLARCERCGAVFVGITPAGVYSDEDDFNDRVQWVPVTGALIGGEA